MTLDNTITKLRNSVIKFFTFKYFYGFEMVLLTFLYNKIDNLANRIVHEYFTNVTLLDDDVYKWAYSGNTEEDMKKRLQNYKWEKQKKMINTINKIIELFLDDNVKSQMKYEDYEYIMEDEIDIIKLKTKYMKFHEDLKKNKLNFIPMKYINAYYHSTSEYARKKIIQYNQLNQSEKIYIENIVNKIYETQETKLKEEIKLIKEGLTGLTEKEYNEQAKFYRRRYPKAFEIYVSQNEPTFEPEPDLTVFEIMKKY